MDFAGSSIVFPGAPHDPVLVRLAELLLGRVEVRHAHGLVRASLALDALPYDPLVRVAPAPHDADGPPVRARVGALEDVPVRVDVGELRPQDEAGLERARPGGLRGVVVRYVVPERHGLKRVLGAKVHHGVAGTGREPVLGGYAEHLKREECVVAVPYGIDREFVGAGIHVAEGGVRGQTLTNT
ncbi:hypothetical protein THAOC_04547 [Thalassiosira oceanica]|uniref:Uncharacterized protein n=1 Tax=Thalassiosira oceanica TaxID=159749 RepID=K0T9P3_THAOC|nr:hypothetical protein THAOC_04547 [Thalassiosira oceanica]|eukprot:EJK73809.1 hypothetical protein THAOC_04547 [Thalassiosira oceanica]